MQVITANETALPPPLMPGTLKRTLIHSYWLCDIDNWYCCNKGRIWGTICPNNLLHCLLSWFTHWMTHSSTKYSLDTFNPSSDILSTTSVRNKALPFVRDNKNMWRTTKNILVVVRTDNINHSRVSWLCLAPTLAWGELTFAQRFPAWALYSYKLRGRLSNPDHWPHLADHIALVSEYQRLRFSLNCVQI